MDRFIAGVLLVAFASSWVCGYLERRGIIKSLQGTEEESSKREIELNQIIGAKNRDLLLLREEHTRTQARLDLSQKTENALRQIIQNAPWGISGLIDLIRLCDEKKDQATSHDLISRKHPAFKAAEVVKEETRRRREIESKYYETRYLLEYYINILPGVNDEISVIQEDLDSVDTIVKAEEGSAVQYLSREEYQALSNSERNQLALDRFWEQNKSKRLIGKLYERYVGYLYEKQGYYVDYFGITEGLSDLGRDLICSNDNEILLVQCKNWSRSKTIYEKHIFQFFGTMYQFAKNNSGKPVRGAFYTATSLSETAKSFAEEFNIELHENFPLERYPMIKCNVSRNGEGIYHLPFDLQYDATKINAKDGDRYCMTVAEAEAAGFRRAYRWHGTE